MSSEKQKKICFGQILAKAWPKELFFAFRLRLGAPFRGKAGRKLLTALDGRQEACEHRQEEIVPLWGTTIILPMGTAIILS